MYKNHDFSIELLLHNISVNIIYIYCLHFTFYCLFFINTLIIHIFTWLHG